MKAAVIHEFGDVDVLKVADVPAPTPKAGHVIVKVLAAGINRLDHYIREGSIVPELPFPHILGADAVGEVFELGSSTGRPQVWPHRQLSGCRQHVRNKYVLPQ